MSLSYDEIAEIVKIIDGSSCDEVIVETADASRAATVRGAEDEEFRYLLMPVRVS